MVELVELEDDGPVTLELVLETFGIEVDDEEEEAAALDEVLVVALEAAA